MTDYNLLGQKFQDFIVEEKTNIRKSKKVVWKCRCDCGNYFHAITSEILSGKRKCCPECSYKRSSDTYVIDLSGQQFGNLLALNRGPNDKFDRVTFLCLCDLCNNKKLYSSNLLRSGRATHCGCKKRPKNNKHVNFAGVGEITGVQLWRIKKAAKDRNIGYKISDEYLWQLFLEQDRKCALTGERIDFIEKTASLDRISSRYDYIDGSIQWVHKTINRMKIDLEPLEFFEMCYRVANFDNIFEYKEFDVNIINGSFIYRATAGAIQRAIEFNITKEDVWRKYCEQGGVCALSGVKLEIPTSTINPDNAASIDRIDNSLSYTFENFQLVHKYINISRGKLSIDEFKSWCKKVAAYAV